jgi:hypothetical protein
MDMGLGLLLHRRWMVRVLEDWGQLGWDTKNDIYFRLLSFTLIINISKKTS